MEFNVKLGASILNAQNRRQTIDLLIEKGINWIHYDLMDHTFVDNKQMPVSEIKALILNSKGHIRDIHIMSKNIKDIIQEIDFNYDYITFHYEATENLKTIFDYFPGQKLGVALNLETDVAQIIPYLDKLSNILLMSVKPGQGGQTFDEKVFIKIKNLKQILIDNNKNNILIGVDGGINDTNASRLINLGVDYLISGSWLINNLKNNKYKLLFNNHNEKTLN